LRVRALYEATRQRATPLSQISSTPPAARRYTRSPGRSGAASTRVPPPPA